MAGAYENSIHQWRVIVVIVVDCECALTLDESAREHYTISVNEAGSRAHKAAGASAPVVGLQNLCCEFESYCPCHKRTLILIQRLAFFLCPESLAPQGFFQFAGCMERAFPLFFGRKRRLMLVSPCFTLPVGCMIKRLLVVWTAYRKIDSEIKHPPVVELRKSKLR